MSKHSCKIRVHTKSRTDASSDTISYAVPDSQHGNSSAEHARRSAAGPDARANHYRAYNYRANHNRANHSRADARNNHSRANHARADARANHFRANHNRANHSRADARNNHFRANHSRADAKANHYRANHSRARARARTRYGRSIINDQSINVYFIPNTRPENGRGKNQYKEATKGADWCGCRCSGVVTCNDNHLFCETA